MGFCLMSPASGSGSISKNESPLALGRHWPVKKLPYTANAVLTPEVCGGASDGFWNWVKNMELVRRAWPPAASDAGFVQAMSIVGPTPKPVPYVDVGSYPLA